MARKSISVLLGLKDKFTSPLKKTSDETKKFQREINKAKKVVNNFGTSVNDKFKSIAKTAAKTLGAASIGAITAGTVKGFSEAFDLETYKAQLETATGSTEKAAELMKYAIDLANRTPFEGGELVEAASKFEAMGMSAEEWLTRAGDMAGATGKDIIQSTEALIDAQSGEWERMKEFGIKGVKDMDKLVSIMDKRFAGGMEKLSKTTKGMWSTVTGVTKNALATIVGVMSDGSVKAGSPLDVLRGYIQKVSDKLVEWQNNGTIEKISDMVADKLGKALDFLGKAIAWVRENANWLLPVIAGVVSTFTAFNVISGVITKISALKTAFSTLSTGAKATRGIVKLLCSGSGIGMIAIAIGAAVAAGILLYKNWDKIKALWERIKTGFLADIEIIKGNFLGFFEGIKETALKLWDNIKDVFNGIKDSIVGAFNTVKEKVSGVFDYIHQKLGEIDDKIESVPVVGDIYKGVKGLFGHATGSAYFKGGATRINEGGRGEIVSLPNGTKIIPNSISKKSVSNSRNINIHVTVQGNVIGNEAYVNEMGEKITQKVILALGNI